MKRKAIFLILGYYILGLIQSCDLNFCEDVDYYDFSGVNIIERNSVIELEDSLDIMVQALNMDFMAENQSYFTIVPNSYAISCDEGWAGMKSPLTKIEVTSNADFSDNYPANTLLNELITIDLCTAEGYYDCERKYVKLNEIDVRKLINPQNQYSANLFIVERPTNANEHKLTIKLFKSNGNIITAQSNSLSWM